MSDTLDQIREFEEGETLRCEDGIKITVFIHDDYAGKFLDLLNEQHGGLQND